MITTVLGNTVNSCASKEFSTSHSHTYPNKDLVQAGSGITD